MMSLTRTRGTGSYTPHLPSVLNTSWWPVLPLYRTTCNHNSFSCMENSSNQHLSEIVRTDEHGTNLEQYLLNIPIIFTLRISWSISRLFSNGKSGKKCFTKSGRDIMRSWNTYGLQKNIFIQIPYE